jgi:hypothetical protein
MGLASGSRVGPYESAAPLGAGGIAGSFGVPLDTRMHAEGAPDIVPILGRRSSAL